jgi:hypothetical protein
MDRKIEDLFHEVTAGGLESDAVGWCLLVETQLGEYGIWMMDRS